MLERDTGLADRVSAELADIVRRAAPSLAAVRAGPHRIASGFVWDSGLVVTSAPAVGTSSAAEVVLPGSQAIVAARADRARHGRFVAFRMPGHRMRAPLCRARTPPRVGAFVVAVGAAEDATPTARLMLVHGAGSAGVLLDGPPDPASEGGPVLDMAGGLLGMAVAARDGGWALVPWPAIARAIEAPGRGWLGIVLEPTSVPTRLRGIAGQESARRVLRLAPGGPAEAAGLQVDDILLALDGFRMSGRGALRGLLAELRVGQEIAARVMRDGRIATLMLIVEAEPDTSA